MVFFFPTISHEIGRGNDWRLIGYELEMPISLNFVFDF